MDNIAKNALSEVRNYYQDVFDKHPADIHVIRFAGIFNDNEMQSIYKNLLNINSSSQLLINYLEKLRFHDAMMPLAQIDIYDLPSNSIQKHAFEKVANSCQNVLDTFGSISREKIYETNGKPQKTKVLQSGFELLELAINRNIKAEVYESKSVFVNSYEIQSKLDDIKQCSGIIDIIKLLQVAAINASQAPKMLLPVKVGGKQRPDIVHLATDLSAYVRMHYKKPLHQCVATTVNVALKLHQHAISADLVRKLTKR